MVEDELHDDDDSALAPFVDALSSALIIMVLIAIFFILQSATSVMELSKQVTVTNMTIEDRELFNPVVFRRPIKVDFNERKIIYLLNFRLDPDEIELLNANLNNFREISIKISSSESPEKVTSMLIHFLNLIENTQDKEIKTSFENISDSVSILTWEGK